jgi:uncharacterized membrane protein YoaK (UPF0700 family)
MPDRPSGTPEAVPPHRRDVRARAGAMVLAAVLAAVAGAVDAICFDRVFSVFPANQSGNAVLLGIGLGQGRGSQAWRPALAIAGFALGVAVAIVLGSRISRRRRPELLLAVEVGLLAPLTIVLLGTAHPRVDLDGLATAGLLLLTCGAMGIQTEIIGRVAGVAVATTYQSGAIVRIAELATRSVDPSARPASLVPGLAVLFVVLGSYVGGAAVGAALGSWPAALVVPLGVLVVVGVLVAFAGDTFDPDPRDAPHTSS